MECPNCGADNHYDSITCWLCFYRLGEEPKRPKMGAQAPGEPSPEAEVPQKNIWKHSSRKKRRRIILWGAVSAVGVAAAVALVMIPITGRENKPDQLKAYSSGKSGISFMYPESWEKKNPQDIQAKLDMQETDKDFGNEIVLLKTGESIFKHLLAVTSRKNGYMLTTWEETESALKAAITESASDVGYKVKFFYLGPKAEKQACCLGYRYKTKASLGPELLQLEALFLKGDMVYGIQFTTPLAGGGSNEEEASLLFRDIINSIEIR